MNADPRLLWLLLLTGLCACDPKVEDTALPPFGGDEDPLPITDDECGYTSGFGPPMAVSDFESGLYYNNRSFLASSGSSGAHLGIDIDAAEGTPVRAGVSGQLIRHRSSDGYGFVAVVAAFMKPSTVWENGNDDETWTVSYLTIYGHIRGTTGLSSGDSTGLSEGDCVSPDTTLGWVQNDAYNGDGAEHLHYGIRLQSASEAQGSSTYWYAGYESDGARQYYADPIDLINATLYIEEWATESVDYLYDLGILSSDSSGYTDQYTWNRASVAAIISRTLNLDTTEAYTLCACPFGDVDVEEDWYAHDVCSLTWLTYSDEASPFRNEAPNEIDFNPGHMLTRAEFLKVLVEAYDWSKVSSGASFDDLEEAPESLRNYIHTAVAMGIVSDDASEFRPNETVSMGEVAVMIHRAIENHGRPTPDETDFSDDPNSQCQGGW